MHNIFKGYIYICDWKWIFNLLYMLSFNPSIKFHMGTERSLVRWLDEAPQLSEFVEISVAARVIPKNKPKISHQWKPMVYPSFAKPRRLITFDVCHQLTLNKHPTLKRGYPLTIDAIDLENCRRKSSVFPNSWQLPLRVNSRNPSVTALLPPPKRKKMVGGPYGQKCLAAAVIKEELFSIS